DGHREEKDGHREEEDGHREEEGIGEYVGNLEQLNTALLGPERSRDLPSREVIASSGEDFDPGQSEEGVPELPAVGVSGDPGQMEEENEDGVPEDHHEPDLSSPREDFGPEGVAEDVNPIAPTEDFGPGFGPEEGFPEDGNPTGPTEDFGPGFGQGEGVVEEPNEVSGTGSDDDFTYHFDEDTMEAAARLAPDPVESSALRPTASPSTKPTKGPLEGLSRPPRKSTVEDDYDDT
ncbi:hypothetical protein FOZ63_018208, partial [Perkinsus olseni]